MAQDGAGNVRNSAEQPVEEWAVSPYGGETHIVAQPVPIFEVAFPNGMWWSIPEEISQQLYQKYCNNEDAVYTWEQRNYIIDFETWEQRNLDNDCRRSVRLVWVTAEEVDPKWTGQLPKRKREC